MLLFNPIAATAFSPPGEEGPEPFHVERPFHFCLADEATGAILFQGRTENPRTS